MMLSLFSGCQQLRPNVLKEQCTSTIKKNSRNSLTVASWSGKQRSFTKPLISYVNQITELQFLNPSEL